MTYHIFELLNADGLVDYPNVIGAITYSLIYSRSMSLFVIGSVVEGWTVELILYLPFPSTPASHSTAIRFYPF